MIAESIAFLVRAGQAGDLRRRALLRRLARRPRLRAAPACARPPRRAPSASCCATPTAARCPTRSPRRPRAVRAALPGVALGIHCHNDADCAVANTLAAVRRRAPRRCRARSTASASAPATPTWSRSSPTCSSSSASGCVSDEQLARLTETGALRRRAAQPRARPVPALRRQARLRPQGRDARRGRARRRRRRSSTIDPALVGNRRDLLVSELAGRGDRGREGARRWAWRSTPTPRASSASRSSSTAATTSRPPTARFELLLRKEAGVYEPLFRLESWRCIVEQRADGKVETEATIKIWVDGERYVRTAEGNGPVNALDRALRDALAEIHPHLADIELVNFKVRILDETKGTGAVTRVLLDTSDGRRGVGLDRRHENIIAASWEALVDSLERGDAAGAPAAARRQLDRALAQAGHRRRAEEARRPRGAALRPALAGPARGRVRAALRARGWARARQRGLQRHRRAAPGAAGGRRGRGRRGRHVAVLVRRLRQRDGLRARAAGVRRHRPAHAQPRPRRPPPRR